MLTTLRDVRPGPAVVAIGCLSLGSFLAWHYPLAPLAMLAAFAIGAVAIFLRPELWLFALPALLPAIGFATWTGWIAVEEFDILALAAAAGGYAARVFRGAQHGSGAVATGATARSTAQAVRLPGYARALLTLFALSILAGTYRGIASAATAGFGWFDGYDDAVNSLRVAKSFFLALLLLPLLQAELRRSGARALDLVASGLAAGLGVASLAVAWERAAFPGLLNFSTDYRVTAPFWEMHVGGAALDGYLALTAPFAVWYLMRGLTPARWVVAGGLALAAGYACLATFSRGVYLALPVSIALLTLCLLMQRRSMSAPAAVAALAKGCAWALAMGAAAYLVFRAGGYRSLLAVLGVVTLMLPIGSWPRRISIGGWVAALALGSVVAAAGWLAASVIPKGNYVIFAAAFVCSAALVWRGRRAGISGSVMAVLVAWVWTVVAAAIVAAGWGGANALHDSSIVLLLLLALTIWNSRARAPLWTDDRRVQAGVVGGAALVAIAVAVFSGGAFMGGRFANSERDLGARLEHWQDGIGMLHTPADWFLGKGLGRFPQSYVVEGRGHQIPGSYRIGSRDENRFLALTGPRFEGGFAEMLRVSQRVSITPAGPYSVVLDVRAPQDAQLHIEICEKLLLYHLGCAFAKVAVNARDGPPQRFVASLDGKNLSGGPWYAPRTAFFSMAVESPGLTVEIDYVSLLGPDGRELLVNGDFAGGMDRWFFTSDALHLPWHIKNLGLDVLFDQGLAGLLLFGLLVGAALVRLVVGRARTHPAAPFLAAALAGFLVVGAFDSLLDVPRVGFVFYLLLLLSFMLPGDAGHVDGIGEMSEPSPRIRPGH